MSKALFILLLLRAAALSGGELPPPDVLAAEIQELKSVVRSLREENQRLKAQNQQLTLDLVNLGRQLRESPRGPDPATIPSTYEPPSSPAPSPAATANNLIQVLYVNPTWHYLLVNAGSSRGLQVGQSGSVLRNGEIIARIKITDTKAAQATAELDLNSLAQAGVYPRKDDEVRFP